MHLPVSVVFHIPQSTFLLRQTTVYTTTPNARLEKTLTWAIKGVTFDRI